MYMRVRLNIPSAANVLCTGFDRVFDVTLRDVTPVSSDHHLPNPSSNFLPSLVFFHPPALVHFRLPRPRPR
jgi:hypothetical protein